MPDGSLSLVAIVVCALAFDYINGLNDTANAIATVVSTRVLSPRSATLMAAALNFAGAMLSTSVAKTVASGLVAPGGVSQSVILAAILGAITWNLITWRFGIPSSSSHALFGGLFGAAATHGGAGVLLWQGLFHKVLIPLIISPVAGFVVGWIAMMSISILFATAHPGRLGSAFRRLQLVSAAAMAFSHGGNDAQKSMGIITMALVAHGVLQQPVVPTWVILACAGAMAAGTSVGGWRIIKTMGHRIIRLEPVHGFSAETTAAAVISLFSHFGMPVSTTHVISGSILGVGASKRLSAVRWGVAQSMVIAWVLTIPASALVSTVVYRLLGCAGMQ